MGDRQMQWQVSNLYTNINKTLIRFQYNKYIFDTMIFALQGF